MENYDYDYTVQDAIQRLSDLGVDVDTDYYKIPVENTDLVKIEKEIPKKAKVVSKHTLIIDSRQRDYYLYPTPSNYLIELVEPHRNVERIELIAAMLPKTEYNINSENNLLIVTIGSVTKQVYLNEGQYIIGSNVYGDPNFLANGTNTQTWGLIGEIKRSLNESFVGNNFDVFLVTAPSPLDPVNPSTGTGRNAAVLNRIVITCDSSFSIDFTNSNYNNGSPFRVLGYQKQVYTSTTQNYIYGSSDTGLCSTSNLEIDAPYRITINNIMSEYDYNLLDDPKYVIMELEFGNKVGERVESTDIATNRKFAVVIYDANEVDNIQTYNSSNSTSNVKIQVDRRPGRLKALKGSDFDKKILVFSPPITLDTFKLSFYKYDNTYYNFHNREHMLTFEVDVADFDPSYRY
jgi:hypothetical protein